ncbi:cbb3-type cytochrome c oxidase subunit 3 [Pseudooceanicola sp. CBS1P-1]|uniref:CcoQ/FixQ family Cbb3-type cytochrome c oxidase assembly chaperone n=1 Tax=Pseudooceanicola albus TaxID=2692189 RepID=A0A6L7G8P8_9RHOB|nr:MULTISPECIES: cbb3-type cytochrome c oxidase subunit 3 [Pseudooceanicola]MBT9386381.1 cbb3-type cytochrome c oxidase subunit 3 [Pseudooceanicola endophyticus]MXN20461.1 CcoQ/FixQ family Cbb3-type cytochrome c oxidase assembly chaperone [Pseudooceanicola albus]
MDTYSLLREFADSWVLLVMFTFFVGIGVWVFRPGSRTTYRETSGIPFRHEDRPAGSTDHTDAARTRDAGKDQ